MLLCSLRDAVTATDSASAASTITVPAGTYQLMIASTGPGDPATGDLDLTGTNPVTITGAGSGQTIIDANHIDRAFAVGFGASLTLEGATVRNGAPATLSSGFPSGGAIYDAGTLTLQADRFTANAATSTGGAVADIGNGQLSVTGSAFAGNNGGTAGGAIDLGGTSPVTVTGDMFTGNTAPMSGGGGGAIHVGASGAVTLDGDEFDRNQTVGSGGAIDGLAPISSHDSSFIGNIAAGNGGAIFQQAGSLKLTNATLSGNEAGVGGGLATNGVPIELVNDTVTGNSLPASGGTSGPNGGGFALSGASTPGTVGVVNTIIAQNTGGDCSGSLSTLDGGHNLDGDGSCVAGAAGDATSPDPKLGAPSNNGGSVLTDAELAGSPAIDTGTDTGCPPADARGVSRPQGAACDKGAYEYITPTSTTTTTTTTTTATTTVPGPTTTTTISGHSDVGPLTVETLIQRLKPSTLYHYRLVATDAAGTSYGTDRTFRTAPAYDGSLTLDSTKLMVHRGDVLVPLNCASTRPCMLRFSITIAARLARTHKLGTLSFSKSTTTLKTIPAHRTVTVPTGSTQRRWHCCARPRISGWPASSPRARAPTSSASSRR